MGLLSFAGDVLGGLLGNDAAEDRQNDAQAFSAQQFATRYQTQVADLKAAGLNPMLSYLNPATGQPSGSAGSVVPYGNLGSNWAAADRDIASARQAEAQALLNESLGKQAVKATEKIGAEISKLEADTNFVKGNTNVDVQQRTMSWLAKKLEYEAGILQVDENRRAEFMQQTIQGLLNARKLEGFDISAMKNSGNLAKNFGQYAPIVKIILDTIVSFRRPK